MAGKNYAEAEIALRRAIELDPDDPTSHRYLGVSLALQGRYDEAEAAFRHAIELAPDDPVSYCQLGNSLDQQGRHDEAESAFRHAIELAPDDPVFYRQLGISLAREDMGQDTEAALREDVEITPDDFPKPLQLKEEGRSAEFTALSIGEREKSEYDRADLIHRVEEGAVLEIVGWRYLVRIVGASLIGTVLAIGGTLTEPTHTKSAASWIFIGALVLSLLGLSVAATLYIERRRQLSWVASLVDALKASPLVAHAPDERTDGHLAEAAQKMAIHLEEAEAFEESRRLTESVGSQPLATP